VFSLQGEAKLKPDNIEPIARAANVTPVRGAVIEHERVKHLTRVYLFRLVTLCSMLWGHSTNIMLHAVGPFDALAQVRAKREQEYQVSSASCSVCFSCMSVAERTLLQAAKAAEASRKKQQQGGGAVRVPLTSTPHFRIKYSTGTRSRLWS
jgi:hypothetical protein